MILFLTNLFFKDADDFVDAKSNTVTPPSEPADPIDDTAGESKGRINGHITRDLSSLPRQQQEPGLSHDAADETLSEIPLDDSHERARQSSEVTDASTITAGSQTGTLTPATTIAPELPPRKRGSVSSASSGVSTPPVHQVTATATSALPARRGPFGWLRSSSSSVKSQPPTLPPRTSMPSVHYASAPSPNIDLLIARLEEQSKLIEKGDEKVREEYAVGNEELRRSFERIQREHQPTEGEDDEIDWGTSPRNSHSMILIDLWNRLVASPQTLAATSPLDLQKALLAGIPSPLRGTIWQILSASKNTDLEQVYLNVLLATSSPQEKLIRKDIARTFPKQDYFRSREGANGQEGLFNVCKAYSLYDPEVNYVQGMAFVVGPLLMNVIHI